MIDRNSNELSGTCYTRGRGALSNTGSRYQPLQTEYVDGADPPAGTTRCRPVQARSIIARNTSPDLPFEQSINPYQGCEHGCIYCYARPSHAYHDLSPGLDFETLINYKQNAAEQLRRELLRPGYRPRGITLGANTDPYQPIEGRYAITRQLLRASKVRHLLRQCRGGADNDSRFGARMKGEGPVAGLLQQRFAKACRRHGLETGERHSLRTDLFRPPRDNVAQMGLFD